MWALVAGGNRLSIQAHDDEGFSDDFDRDRARIKCARIRRGVPVSAENPLFYVFAHDCGWSPTASAENFASR